MLLLHKKYFILVPICSTTKCEDWEYVETGGNLEIYVLEEHTTAILPYRKSK